MTRMTGDRTIIIAEVASGHDGRSDLAIELARLAAEAGADAVKYQMFRAADLVARDHPKAEAFRQIEIDAAGWERVVRSTRDMGLRVFADIYDLASLDLAERLGIEAYKITTTVTGDWDLLRALAKTGKPLLVAVSGETEHEVTALLDRLNAFSPGEVILHHGFQGFPTQIDDTHLRRLEWLRERFGLPVGFADHCPGEDPICTLMPVIAVALGARVIEKHLTKNRSERARDWVSALNPDEFRSMTESIRKVERARGDRCPVLSSGEIQYHEAMQKKAVAAEPLQRGTLLTRSHLALKRTTALAVDRLEPLLGKKLLRDVSADEGIRAEDVRPPRTLILIAVRMKSTRLPGKALLPLAGKPVLHHLVDRLRLASDVGEVVLCTSTNPQDRVLLEEAARLGIHAHAGSEDDVMARFLDVADKQEADVIVRVTGDNPLTDPDAIAAMVRQHCDHGADYTFTEDLPRGTRPEVISVAALRRAHDLAEDPAGSEYMTLYFKNNASVFKLQRWDASDPLLKRPAFRLTLDTPEDLKVLEFIYGKLYRADRMFSLSEVIGLLDGNPECASWNAHVPSRIPPEINARLKVTA